jgi:hypothetical protein
VTLPLRRLVSAMPRLTNRPGKKVAAKIEANEGSARKLMAVARDPRIANRAHVRALPPSWGTLYVLSKLDDAQWEKGLADGVIHPGMERGEALMRLSIL